jgi:hypothetical protein
MKLLTQKSKKLDTQKSRMSKGKSSKGMSISTGFEFQTDQISFVIINGNKEVVYSLEKRDVKHLSPQVSVYADALTSSNKNSLYSFLRGIETSNLDWSLLIDSKPYRMPRHHGLANEAEFVVTYRRMEKVEQARDVFLKYLVKKQEAALMDVRRFLENNQQSKITGMIGYSSDDRKRGKQAPVPYETLSMLGKDKNDETYYVAYKKGETLKQLSFYAQCTIGIELKYVVWALSVLADVYTEMKYTSTSDDEEMKKWKKVLEDTKDSGLTPYLHTILILFLYSFLTKGNRKASPFIFRHTMSDVLASLTPEEKSIIRNSLINVMWNGYGSDITMYYDTVWYYGTEHSGIRDSEKKAYEKLEITSTFEYVPKGLNSVVLVEIRYFNRLLNYIKRGKKVKGNDANNYIPLYE